MSDVKPGRYRHFKGREYRVLGIGRDSETLAEMVVYRALYDSPEFGPDQIWLRPKEMFLGSVEREGRTVPRFEYLGE